ncbi:MAG: DNA translocase FtsK 4TM domain-containing protein, partial [Alphaproteobacteria bacterium]|nr:DNA translocase FtsK 4TM domain-containing protein [Alphaproteobacteria bacterium]
MAVAVDSRRLASPALRSLARRRLAEIAALGLAVAGIALLVALGSYHPGDPSLDTATAGGVGNLAGRPGAAAADILLQGFGVAGLLPGFAFLAWAWRIGSHRGLSSLPLRVVALLAGLPALGAVLAAVPNWHGQRLLWPAGAGLGG